MVKIRLLRLLRVIILLYALTLVAMVSFQRSLLYHPDPRMGLPASYQFEQAKQITLAAADGTAPVAWVVPPQEGRPVILYFQGNGGNLSYRVEKLKALTQTGMGLIALSYRGYGSSPGKPTEDGLYQDAAAVITYARNQMGLPPERLIYYGESLGSGVAVQMSAELPPGLLVLEAPFTSAVDRGAELYPWLPVRLFMRDRYDSIDKLDRVRSPLLLFHNTGDTVIPITHGKALFQAANKPKRAIWFQHEGHVDFDWNRLAQEIDAYYARHHSTQEVEEKPEQEQQPAQEKPQTP